MDSLAIEEVRTTQPERKQTDDRDAAIESRHVVMRADEAFSIHEDLISEAKRYVPMLYQASDTKVGDAKHELRRPRSFKAVAFEQS